MKHEKKRIFPDDDSFQLARAISQIIITGSKLEAAHNARCLLNFVLANMSLADTAAPAEYEQFMASVIFLEAFSMNDWKLNDGIQQKVDSVEQRMTLTMSVSGSEH